LASIAGMYSSNFRVGVAGAIRSFFLPVFPPSYGSPAICLWEYLRTKAIPFIFLSTSADPKAVYDAFELSVQGFFVKENTYDGIQQQLRQIIDYWRNCKHPNSTE